METIKNYLESMFATLPDTQEVRNAKAELLQMMEDKYNELVSGGMAENAAVGTVISEFGNLDELAETLGLAREVSQARKKSSEMPRRIITIDEAKAYFSNRSQKSLIKSIGIMMCIICVAPVLMNIENEVTGITLMFLCIALGVGLIIYSSCMDYQWKYIGKELCSIDMNTASYVKDRRRSFEPVRMICVAVGVALCVICWVPNIIFTEFSTSIPGAALMFVLIGIGVLLIVYGNSVAKGFDRVLNVNDKETVSGSYKNVDLDGVKFKNKTAETIVTLYWPTVTCIYLVVSFLTFSWHLTWLIYVIAGVAHRAVVMYCREDD